MKVKVVIDAPNRVPVVGAPSCEPAYATLAHPTARGSPRDEELRHAIGELSNEVRDRGGVGGRNGSRKWLSRSCTIPRFYEIEIKISAYVAIRQA